MESVIQPCVAGVNPASDTHPGSPNRLVGLDILRIVAALAVVYIHVPETGLLFSWAPWGRFAVPSFTTMSVFLLLMNLPRKPVPARGQYVRERFFRLYALFLLWNVIYLVARLVKKALVTEPGDPLRLSPGTVLFSGFAEHLWYLSSLAWVTLLMAGVIWLYLDLRPAHRLWLALALAGAGTLVCAGFIRVPIDLDAWPSSYFAAFSLNNVAAACFALLVGWLWIHPLAQRPNGILCLVFLAFGVVALWRDVAPDTRVLWGAVAAPCFVLAALTLPVNAAPPALGVLAACALPVYCVHILFIQAMHALTHKLHFGASTTLDLVTLLVTIAGSFLFGFSLRRLRPTHWFVALHR